MKPIPITEIGVYVMDCPMESWSEDKKRRSGMEGLGMCIGCPYYQGAFCNVVICGCTEETNAPMMRKGKQ